MKYRVPVEFEATDDDRARERAAALAEDLRKLNLFGDPPLARTDELAVGKMYWDKVAPKS